MGIEYEYLCALDVGKALKSRLAGIAACCDKDADLAVFPALFKRGSKQMRKHLKRHVLKRAGGAVPQLQHRGFPVYKVHGRNIRMVEILSISSAYHIFELFHGKFIEEKLHYHCSSFPIIHTAERVYITLTELRQGLGYKKSAVGSKPPRNSLGRGNLMGCISCAEIFHINYLKTRFQCGL